MYLSLVNLYLKSCHSGDRCYVRTVQSLSRTAWTNYWHYRFYFRSKIDYYEEWLSLQRVQLMQPFQYTYLERHCQEVSFHRFLPFRHLHLKQYRFRSTYYPGRSCSSLYLYLVRPRTYVLWLMCLTWSQDYCCLILEPWPDFLSLTAQVATKLLPTLWIRLLLLRSRL